MDDEEKLALLREQYPNLTDEELEEMLDEQYIDFMVEAFEVKEQWRPETEEDKILKQFGF